MDAMEEAFSTDLVAGIVAEAANEATADHQESVALPASPSIEKTPSEHVFVPLPPGSKPQSPLPVEVAEPPIDEPNQEENRENVPMPAVEAEPEEPMAPIEVEFRELVNGLLAAGVDPTEMMDDPRWEDINERAAAVGFETWPVFLHLATMKCQG